MFSLMLFLKVWIWEIEFVEYIFLGVYCLEFDEWFLVIIFVVVERVKRVNIICIL